MAERHEKKRRANQGLARARLLFRKDLAWTRGFPRALFDAPVATDSEPGTRSAKAGSEAESGNAIPWICPDSLYGAGTIRQIFVDREQIRKSVFAASKLRHQYPKCLPKLFPDPVSWLGQLDRLLETCKRVVHDGSPAIEIVNEILKEDVFGEAGCRDRQHHQNGFFQALVAACRMTDALASRPLGAALDCWLQKHRAALVQWWQSVDFETGNKAGNDGPISESIRVPILIATASLSCDETEDPTPQILAALSNRELCELPLLQLNQLLGYHANRALEHFPTQKSKSKPSRLPASSPPCGKCLERGIVHRMEQACLGNQAVRKSVGQFLAQFGHPAFLAELKRIESGYTTETRRLQGLRSQLAQMAQAGLLPRKKSDRQPLIQAAKFKHVPSDDERWLKQIVSYLEDGWFERRSPELISAIASWWEAAGDETRIAWWVVNELLSQVESSGRYPWQDAALTEVVAQLTRLVQTVGPGNGLALFSPLREPVENAHKCELFEPWLEPSDACDNGVPSRRLLKHQLKKFVDYLISRIEATRPLRSAVTINSAGAVWRAIGDPEYVDTFLDLLDEAPPDYAVELDDFRAIVPFSDGPVDAVQISRKLIDGKVDSFTLEQLRPLAEHWAGRSVVLAWLNQEATERLEQLGTVVSCLKRVSFTLPQPREPADSPDWVADYPSAFHSPLQRLAGLTADAERIAGHLLRQDFVDKTKRSAELAHLQSRLRDTNLAPELRQKLEARCLRIGELMAMPASVSLRRQQRLLKRLEGRVLLESERWLERALSAGLEAAIGGWGVTIEPGNFANPVVQRIVAGLLGLEPHERKLGLQLLSLGLRGATYPELDHAENKAFVQTLQDAGIGIAPWLDAVGRWEQDTEGQPTIVASFSQDPLDYLLMGHHFKTCLSPGDFNFFSTISAAVDINKRVLYIRDDQNRIQGRCLVALGARGELVRYRVYAHTDIERIEQLVERVLDELAAQMGTARSCTAKVPQLASRRWYDDGIVGTTGDAATSPADHLRKQIDLWDAVDVPTDRQRAEMGELIEACLESHGTVVLVEAIARRENWRWHLPADWVVELLLDTLCGEDVEPDVFRLVASIAWDANRKHWVAPALEHLTVRQTLTLFRRSVCRITGCYNFHELGSSDFVEAWLRQLPPHVALRALRLSRRKEIRADTDEVCPHRRRMLAKAHRRLGRTRLPETLETTPKLGS